MSVKPIEPDEVAANKVNVLPDFVIEAVNELITIEFDGHSAVFLQKEIVNLIVKKMGPLPGSEGDARNSVYANGWLNFVPLFEEFGWKVDYDRPGFSETYEANYTFKRKRK